jgi:hypothetical protein
MLHRVSKDAHNYLPFLAPLLILRLELPRALLFKLGDIILDAFTLRLLRSNNRFNIIFITLLALFGT